jgi:hypothetical protein
MVLGWSSGPCELGWVRYVVRVLQKSAVICPTSKTKSYQMTSNIHRANQFHAHPCHHLLTCPEDDNQWFWGSHLAHVSHAGSDMWLGFDKNRLWFAQLQRQNPTRWHPTSTEPINSMLIHAIISWHVQMMIIDGFGVVIWPMWVRLGRICG